MNYAKIAEVKNIVACALREDIAGGDITTRFLIPKGKTAKAVILAKEPCVVCGLNIAALVFKTMDKAIKFQRLAGEGELVKKGRVIARVSGRARSILSAERVALNFLSHLSGISTQVRRFTLRLKPGKAKIIDTRKTIPGLRILQKYAVRIGGGYNHRYSLDEMVMVKDNHLKAVGGLDNLPRMRSRFNTEIEVKNLSEFRKALLLAPDMIMLDNMGLKQMRKAVLLKRKTQNAKRKTLLEASGGITLQNVRKVASTGVDLISIGALTHSVPSVDISLEIL